MLELKQFAINLDQILNDSRMTPKILAKELGVKVTTIWKYKSGHQNVPLKNLIALSKILGCTPNDLLEGYFYTEHEMLVREFFNLFDQSHPMKKEMAVKLVDFFANKMKDMIFAQRLKLVRRDKALDVNQFAKMLNVSLSSYKNYESGNQTPKIETLIAMCAACEVTPDVFLWNHFSTPKDSLREKFNNIIPSDIIEIIRILK